jgi:hypothetical protein
MKKFLLVILFSILIIPSLLAQSVTSVVLPQYMEGLNGTNADRVPVAYCLTLSGLTANTTYRFINQIAISADASTSGGAGNVIYIKTDGTDFVRTSSTSLSTAGGYGSFTTDSKGNYTGWFITEPTGNATRFIPGKYNFPRISLNDGGTGTTAVTRLTTADSIKVLKMGTTATDTAGTLLIGLTGSAQAKDFVVLYDNIAGTGRPIAASYIESDGTANTTANSFTAAYASTVDAVTGAFGVMIPNILTNGIRRIERRSLTTGAVVAFVTDADGVWPSGANTVNPAGGKTPITLTATDLAGLVSTNYILMNEIYSNGKSTAHPELDWIELYNTSSAQVDISGYKIYDSGGYGGTKTKKTLASGTVIAAKGYYVVTTDGSNSDDFGLSSSGEEVWLENASGVVIDDVTFPALTSTQSYSRIPDGTSWVTSSNVTSGAANGLTTAVEDKNVIPTDFKLNQNYPNPFNPETVISYQLPTSGYVTLKVYNILGKEVATLVNEYQQAGSYNAKFSISSYKLSSGVYFYSLKSGSFSQTKKMILMK